jgi:NAD(P)-dependent dehydrogenase (short-subunit alcohol dehydrogenase family)
MRLTIVIAAFAALAATSANAATVLITGSNRGIGLEFARQYAALGWDVIATSRTPEDDDDLQALASKYSNLRVESLDVSDHAQIDSLAAKLSGTSIDVLLNNAGILGGEPDVQTIGSIDFDSMAQVYKTNAIGPMKMAEAFLPHVEASDQKKITVITSGTASLRTSDRHRFTKRCIFIACPKPPLTWGIGPYPLKSRPRACL